MLAARVRSGARCLRAVLALVGLIGVVGCSGGSSSGSEAAKPGPTPAESARVPEPHVLGQRTRTTACLSRGGLPDPACTPGATDPRVTQATLGTTICSRGYTETVRPPVSVTDRIKREQMAAYGLQGRAPSEYELDHLVGLEVGGAPADAANLWPEPRVGDANAREKDAVENFLHREVCRGAMQLAEAQFQIATDWLAVYRSHNLQP